MRLDYGRVAVECSLIKLDSNSFSTAVCYFLQKLAKGVPGLAQ